MKTNRSCGVVMTDMKKKPDSSMQIAAVVRNGSCDVDQLLKDAARDLQEKGYRVGGVVRVNERQADTHPCDVVLEELTTGNTIPLSQDCGPTATGCQLDTAALARVAGLVDASIEQALDLLIINKFGKREAEGSGFLETIARAVEIGIPVIVSVSEDHGEAWNTFCGKNSQLLAPERDVVKHWLDQTLRDI